MTTIKLMLPDQLALEAQRAGLLDPDLVERWLREELRAKKASELFAATGRMSAIDEPGTMTPEEISKELDSLRAKRREPSSL